MGIELSVTNQSMGELRFKKEFLYKHCYIRVHHLKPSLSVV